MAPLESSRLPLGEGMGGWPRGPTYGSLSLHLAPFPPTPAAPASLPPVIVLSSSSLGDAKGRETSDGEGTKNFPGRKNP